MNDILILYSHLKLKNRIQLHTLFAKAVIFNVYIKKHFMVNSH